MLRRLWRAGRTDTEIAAALPRDCGAAAVAWRRGRLRLCRVPSYERWRWALPDTPTVALPKNSRTPARG